MRNNWWLLLFLLAFLLLPGCDKFKPDVVTEEEVSLGRPVETVVVEGRNFNRVRSYVGNLTAYRQVKVIPLATERILKFPWENGDFIKKGEVIAEIRNEVNRKSLDALNAQARSVDAQLKAAERELKRVDSLVQSNIVSRQQFDKAQDGVTTLLASKQQISASQEQQKLGLDYARVVAPIDGVVSQKMSEAGDIASSAMPLCVLLDLSQIKVTLNINEEDVAFLKVGQEIGLHFDAYPGQLKVAKLTRIMPFINLTTRTNTVEAMFENEMNDETQQYRYKPGMYARATLLLESSADVVVAPPRAMLLDQELIEQQKPGQTLRKAFVLQADGTVDQRTVEVGEQSGGVVQVLSGLSKGEKLVIRGHHGLKNGDLVRDVTKVSPTVVAEAKAVAADPI